MSDNLTVRYTPLADLLPWDRNPKRHDLGAIAESMTRYGFKDPPKYEPLLNNGRGGIVEGNGRIEALQWMKQQGQHAPRGIVSDDSGGWLVPVLYGVDAASEASAAAYGVDHNNLVLSGGDFTAVDAARLWDSQTYAALVNDLAGLDEVPESIGDDAVSALIATLQHDDKNARAGGDEFDATPAESGPTRAQRGDLWEIVGQGGRVHRLLCGDSTSADDVARLMDGRRADAVVTDPPYRSGGFTRGDRTIDARSKYVNKDSEERPTIAGDNKDQRSWIGWSERWLSVWIQACRDSAFIAVWTDWRQLPATTDYYQGAGAVWRGVAVWDKTMSARAMFDRFRHQAEYLVWGSVGNMPLNAGGNAYAGVFSKSVDSDKEHITQKPIDVAAWSMLPASAGGIVADPFLGSGTTLIAAERTGRVCYGLEISERYCDVILKRAEAEGMACRKVDSAA